jgi:hypothetical protein
MMHAGWPKHSGSWENHEARIVLIRGPECAAGLIFKTETEK